MLYNSHILKVIQQVSCYSYEIRSAVASRCHCCTEIAGVSSTDGTIRKEPLPKHTFFCTNSGYAGTVVIQLLLTAHQRQEMLRLKHSPDRVEK